MGTRESAVIQPLTSHLTNHLSKTNNLRRKRRITDADKDVGKKTNSEVNFLYGTFTWT